MNFWVIDINKIRQILDKSRTKVNSIPNKQKYFLMNLLVIQLIVMDEDKSPGVELALDT